ncbi:MAG: hypothetical protein N2645_07560 [Clostridia bacterium]|nr:hypothetical protein [Clostridia bacterium]
MRLKFVWLLVLFVLILFSACSQSKNTASSVYTHSPTAAKTEEVKPQSNETPKPTLEVPSGGGFPSAKEPAGDTDALLEGRPAAIFTWEKNIYFYKAQNAKMKEIGDAKRPKEFLGMSPEGGKAAYKYISSDNTYVEPEIGIIEGKSGKVKEWPLKNDLMRQMQGFWWINGKTFMVTGHINPSVAGYILYDSDTNEEINACAGLLYSVLPDGKKMMYRENPHVFPQIKANIWIDQKRIFEVENPLDQIEYAKVSRDFKKIAFLEYGFDQEKAYLVLADFDSQKMKMGQMIKTLLESNVEVQNDGDREQGTLQKYRVQDFVISEDFKKLAFMMKGQNGSESYIGTAETDVSRSEVGKIKKVHIRVSDDLRLKFDKNNTLFISDSRESFELNHYIMMQKDGINPGEELTDREKERDEAAFKRFEEAFMRYFKGVGRNDAMDAWHKLKWFSKGGDQ